MMWCLVWIVFLFSMEKSTDTVYYQSDSIQALEFVPFGAPITMLDDLLDTIEVKGYVDQNGILYWHRKLHTPVCQTGECKEIDVGLYWKCTGEFLGLEVYKEHLTRTDHSIFSESDYDLLMSVLMNDWSILREYEYEDLLSEPVEESERPGEAEAITGATRKEIAEETVKDAVFTTYTLWHLIHVGEKEQLRAGTAAMINQDMELLDRLTHSPENQYSNLALELFAEGKLSYTSRIGSHIISSLDSGKDNTQRELAIKSLAKLDFDRSEIQDKLASFYSLARPNEKGRILNYLGSPTHLTPSLYAALTDDLSAEDEWLAGRSLEIIKVFPRQSDRTIELAKALSQSRNSFTRRAAENFLAFVEKIRK